MESLTLSTFEQFPRSRAWPHSEWADIFLKNPSHFEDNVLFGYFAIFPTFIILRNLNEVNNTFSGKNGLK